MEDKPWGDFCEIFGVTPRNRILEFFLSLDGLDFTISDIAEEVRLNRATTYNTMKELINDEYIILSRKVSAGQLYKLNKNKLEVKKLLKVMDQIIDKIYDDYTKKEKVYA